MDLPSVLVNYPVPLVALQDMVSLASPYQVDIGGPSVSHFSCECEDSVLQTTAHRIQDMDPQLEGLRFRKPIVKSRELNCNSGQPHRDNLLIRQVLQTYNRSSSPKIVKPKLKVKRLKMNVEPIDVKELYFTKKPLLELKTATEDTIAASSSSLIFQPDQENEKYTQEIISTLQEIVLEEHLEHHHLLRIMDLLYQLDTNRAELKLDTQVLRNVQKATLQLITESLENEQDWDLTFKGFYCLLINLTILNLDNDKLLHLDTCLKSLVTFFCTKYEDIIEPLSTLSIGESTVTTDSFSLIFELCKQSIVALSIYCVNHRLDDYLFTRLEYVCITIITHHTDHKRKNLLMDYSRFSPLKVAASDLLLSIFRFFPDQREFILTEFCYAIHKLDERNSKVYRVQSVILDVFTVTLIRMIQVETLDFRQLSLSEVTKVHDEIQNILQIVFATLMERVVDHPKLRSKLEYLIQDVLQVLSDPHFPGASLLIKRFMKGLSESSDNDISILIAGLIAKSLNEKLNFENREKSFDLSMLPNLLLQLDWSAATTILVNCIVSSPSPEDTLSKLDFSNSTGKAPPDVDVNIYSLYDEVLNSQSLLQLYDRFLVMMLNNLDSKKPKTRLKAMKTVSLLLSREVLDYSTVKKIFIKGLRDSSPIINNWIIQEASKYIDKEPYLTDFYLLILDKLFDESISVRKGALKCLKSMYIVTQDVSIQVQIAEGALKLLEDEEESMVMLAGETLLELWFYSLDVMNNEDNPAAYRLGVHARVEIMAQLLARSNKNKDSFVEFIRSFLNDEKNNDTNSSRMVLRSIKAIADSSLESIVENEGNGKAEHMMCLTSTLVLINGEILNQDQLVFLKPYLDEHSNTVTCYYTLKLFKHSLPLMKNLASSFTYECLTLLLEKLTKFNVKELFEAMPTVYYLSKLQNDTRYVNAAISCLRLLRPFVNSNHEGDLNAKLTRLLYLAGSFGRCCYFETYRDLFEKNNITIQPNEPVVSVFVRSLLLFTKPPMSRKIRRIAIRNLMELCVTHPKFFLSKPLVTIMDEELQSDYVDTKEVIIQGIFEFLSQHEETSINNSDHSNKNSKQISLDVEVFHGKSPSFVNESLGVSLVHKYMPYILKMCIFDEGYYSLLPVRFIDFVVRLGMANPKVCISTIVCLESSSNRTIRSLALQIHRELHNKHESLIESSYVEGVRMATEYRKAHSKDMWKETFFLPLFLTILGDNKSSRRKFFSNLLRSFINDVRILTESDSQAYRDYVCFVVLNLANVSFITLEEVYLIIRGIDGLLSKQGAPLSAEIDNQENEHDGEGLSWRGLSFLVTAFLTLEQFKEFLISRYGVLEEKLLEFRPQKVDKELRQPIRQFNEKKLFDQNKVLHRFDMDPKELSLQFSRNWS
ncbi:Cohesin loading factor component [Komagataella phaffii CBS 7435]|uniref:Sister chromatid cohesion protein n=2 Tax=Komagataella phaffii TaxID=460519 RepID=C4R4F1_KOMPG|nr:uncharacterized protein PAS_chr3_1186 [Komagataella phaffii GS115]AOA63954.1 GQ67_03457T0 [Komagataella phaffii]CAH2449808.1 Cohesin loading factor component [Komagataella phaffii CBS 7435]AOA69074.1 GQ68_03427T0 [Komagataella phaffii GS115]CAY70437.1 hypothetical protein PAS_chr3_1186 [Komagataella phaffii GS115]CCA39775.2 Cohesin loading factor component [Komagataella phaffii CBS 7435]